MKERDMYLPAWVCGLGIFLILAAIASMVYCFVDFSVWGIIGAIMCLGFGVPAILCWRNQWAVVLSSNEFIYSTMFGRQTIYRFSQITGLKQNSDSMTLLLEDKKVHIEKCAIISDRFADHLDQALERIQ